MQVKAAQGKVAETPLHDLKPGDFVVVRDLRRKSWKAKRWLGPFQVLLTTHTAVNNCQSLQKSSTCISGRGAEGVKIWRHTRQQRPESSINIKRPYQRKSKVKTEKQHQSSLRTSEKITIISIIVGYIMLFSYSRLQRQRYQYHCPHENGRKRA